jgi:hypothetical protein
MSARTAKAKAADLTAVDPDGPIANELFDAWRHARTDRATTDSGYTPALALYRDFSSWHEAAYPDVPVPTEGAFTRALRFVPKIIFKMMKVQPNLAPARMATCANLTLRAALRSVA